MGKSKTPKHRQKLKEAYHNNRHKSVVKVILPDWSSNHCKHLRNEVGKPDKDGLATQTCLTCNAHRIIPATIYLIEEGLRLNTIKRVNFKDKR